MQINKDYKLGKLLSTSGEALVYFGKLTNPEFKDFNGGIEKVAVKCSKKKEQISTNFKQEIAIIWMFNQKKNFLKLVGYNETPPSMVMKYYGIGSLKDYISQTGPIKIPDKKWNPEVVVPLAMDVISALSDMHEAGLVHNDMKTANVLMDRDERGTVYAVLSDFGLTTVVDKSLLSVKGFQASRIKGASIIYAAPEALQRYRHVKMSKSEKTSKILKAGDVYSYGMILFELIVRRTPWKELRTKDDIEESILKGKHPRFKANSILETQINASALWQALMELAQDCWTFEPKQRPTSADIVKKLKRLPK